MLTSLQELLKANRSISGVKARRGDAGIQRNWDKDYKGELGSFKGSQLAIQDALDDLQQAQKDLEFDLREIQDCKMWLARLGQFAKKGDRDAYQDELLDERDHYAGLQDKYSSSALARVRDTSRFEF